MATGEMSSEALHGRRPISAGPNRKCVVLGAGTVADAQRKAALLATVAKCSNHLILGQGPA